MAESLIGLAGGDELQAIYNEKSKEHDEKTITAGTKEALSLKVAGEQADGWFVLKENIRSTRVAKVKSEDRKLEDDVWCLLYRMGFKELNRGRQFLAQVGNSAPPRQLDVFAKDDETAIIVECTHSKENGSKSVKSLIDKVCAVRDEVINAIHRHYGKAPRLKVKFAIATRNIDWRAADRQRAEDARIAIIDEKDLAYFQKLTDLLKGAARYQFLGRYFRGEKVEGLKAQVPATRGRMGNAYFYNFLISPHDLLKVSYISHRSATSNDDIETYQRMVKASRLKSIGAYIDNGGKFPTNIVVNLKVDGSMNFDLKERFGDTSTGILHLPAKYGSAWVIDGQHRLYGYAHATRTEEQDNSVITVLAYENLPLKEEIALFVDINTQQVKVSRNLVHEIISSLKIDDEDPKMRLEALLARTALRLDEYKKSPISGRVLTVSEEKSNVRCLTLTSLADGIGDQNLLGTVHRATNSISPGKLSHSSGDPKLSMDRAVQILSSYFDLFATGLESHWALGDAKGGYLCTNLGVRALLQLLRRLVAYIEQTQHKKFDSMDATEFVAELRPYVQPIVDYFKSADANTIAAFRTRGSSLASVDQNCLQLMSIIHEAVPTFNPPEVAAYMSNRDIEGTKEAKEKIDEINAIIYKDVLDTLKDNYGEGKDAWWVKGIPKGIRNDCDKLFNENNGERDRWQYLFFSNYADIVVHGDNWELFKDHYNFYGKGKKADLVRWLGHVNKIRTVTHHAEKGPLTKDEVQFVRDVYALVKRHIEGGDSVSGKRLLFQAGVKKEMDASSGVSAPELVEQVA
jgi:DNA sulfur modification protein DndB